MWLVFLYILVEQGRLVQVVFQYILDALVCDGICLYGPFACVVQSLGTIGLVQLDKPHGTFVADLGIIPRDYDLFYTGRYILPVEGGFLFKKFGTPVRIIFMGTVQVIAIGVVASLSGIALVQGYSLMVIINFHSCRCIMDLGMLADVAIGRTIIAFVR